MPVTAYPTPDPSIMVKQTIQQQGEHKVSDREPSDGVSEHIRPLLEALRNEPARAEYYRGLLNPLQRYDREHHGDLVKTLNAYLRHGGNATHTANALFLHRNSLRYRLARIKALSGLDPDDPDVRLALQVAIYIRTED
jgi:DNA-binding PucR family transcriptional regulator